VVRRISWFCNEFSRFVYKISTLQLECARLATAAVTGSVTAATAVIGHFKWHCCQWKNDIKMIAAVDGHALEKIESKDLKTHLPCAARCSEHRRGRLLTCLEVCCTVV
jgi:hypothetical protein